MIEIYILLICYVAMKLIMHMDKDSGIKINIAYRLLFLFGSILAGIWLRIAQVNIWIYGVLFAYLLVSVCTDLQIMKVYDFMAYLALTAGGVLYALTPMVARGNLPELVTFLVLQKLLFSRMMGGGDCLAFSVCAVYIAAGGGGMPEFLLHMLTAVLLCGGYKFMRWLKTGRRREPVAFVPYIAIGIGCFL